MPKTFSENFRKTLSLARVKKEILEHIKHAVFDYDRQEFFKSSAIENHIDKEVIEAINASSSYNENINLKTGIGDETREAVKTYLEFVEKCTIVSREKIKSTFSLSIRIPQFDSLNEAILGEKPRNPENYESHVEAAFWNNHASYEHMKACAVGLQFISQRITENKEAREEIDNIHNLIWNKIALLDRNRQSFAIMLGGEPLEIIKRSIMNSMGEGMSIMHYLKFNARQPGSYKTQDEKEFREQIMSSLNGEHEIKTGNFTNKP